MIHEDHSSSEGAVTCLYFSLSTARRPKKISKIAAPTRYVTRGSEQRPDKSSSLSAHTLPAPKSVQQAQSAGNSVLVGVVAATSRASVSVAVAPSWPSYARAVTSRSANERSVVSESFILFRFNKFKLIKDYK